MKQPKFMDVVKLLDDAVGGADAPVGQHGAFWRDVTRDDFTRLVIYGEPLLTSGNASESRIINALQGTDPFDGSLFPQMPVGFPVVSTNDIQIIAAWIDLDCPE